MSELTLVKHLRQFRYFVVEFSAQGGILSRRIELEVFTEIT